MQPILVTGAMSRFDINRDGKISFDEFIGNRSKILLMRLLVIRILLENVNHEVFFLVGENIFIWHFTL